MFTTPYSPAGLRLRATDKKGTANDGIALKNVIFAGMWKNFYEDDKVSENFFNLAGSNTTLATDQRDYL